MINPEHKFDHEIKRALENYQAPYQPDDWLLMEQMLDHAEERASIPLPQKGITTLRNSVLVLSFVCLMLMSAGLVYQRMEYKQPPLPTSMLPAAFTPSQPAQTKVEQLNNSITATTYSTPNSGTANSTSISTEIALLQTHHTTANALHNTALKPPAALPHNNVASPNAFNLLLSAANAPLLPYATATQTHNNRLGVTIANATNGGLYTEANSAPQAAALLAFLPTLKTDFVTAQTTPKQVKALQTLIINPEQPAAAEPIVAIAPKLPPKSGRLALAAVTSTDANWLSGNQQSGGFSSGLNLSYAIGKHWGISAGALFSQKKWVVRTGQHNSINNTTEINNFDNPEIWNSKEQSSIMMNMLEIPVSLTFNILPGKKINPYLRAGVSAWLPFQNMVSYNQYNYGSLSQTGTANQTILANMPFTPNPRPNSTLLNDSDPLLSTPVIYDDITDLPASPNIYNSHFQDYWINSNPDFQSVMVATEYIQIPNAPGINQPVWDIVHLTAGVNYHIGKQWLLLAETRFSSSITRHRFDAKLSTPLQPTQGQRLFSGSMTVGFAYRFK